MEKLILLFVNRLIAIIRAKNENSCFEITSTSKDLPNVSLRYGTKQWYRISSDNSIKYENDFIPSRKIEIIADGSTKMNEKNLKINVTGKVLPENATLKEINWNPVLKECIKSDFISVIDHEEKPKEEGVEMKTIQAEGDGECILRCTARNGTEYDEIISDLPFSISSNIKKIKNIFEKKRKIILRFMLNIILLKKI